MDILTDVEKRVINQLTNRNSDRLVEMKCIDCGTPFETTVGMICGAYHNGLIVQCRCLKCKQEKDAKFKLYAEEDAKKV